MELNKKNMPGERDPGQAPLLTARGLGKSYNYHPVLRGVDLELAPGALLLVRGPNGAGKSTLLRILAGLTRSEEGSFQLNAPPCKISYMNHEPCAYAGLSALQNLKFWTRLNDFSFSRAELLHLLEEAGLVKFAHKNTQNFSQGMLQRLNLARCFAGEPCLVFLDEPGANLDQEGFALLQRKITNLRESGGAAVLVSHHLSKNPPPADMLLALETPHPQVKAPSVSYYGPASGFKLQDAEGEYV